jgi:hypothetical protein
MDIAQSAARRRGLYAESQWVQEWTPTTLCWRDDSDQE